MVRRGHSFQVPGLGRRVSGSATQVQAQVQALCHLSSVINSAINPALHSVLNSGLYSVICHRFSPLPSIQPSPLPPLPPLLSPVIDRGTPHLPLEQAIKEGHLAEAAGQGDVQDAPFAIPKLTAGGL